MVFSKEIMITATILSSKGNRNEMKESTKEKLTGNAFTTQTGLRCLDYPRGRGGIKARFCKVKNRHTRVSPTVKMDRVASNSSFETLRLKSSRKQRLSSRSLSVFTGTLPTAEKYALRQ